MAGPRQRRSEYDGDIRKSDTEEERLLERHRTALQQPQNCRQGTEKDDQECDDADANGERNRGIGRIGRDAAVQFAPGALH